MGIAWSSINIVLFIHYKILKIVVAAAGHWLVTFVICLSTREGMWVTRSIVACVLSLGSGWR